MEFLNKNRVQSAEPETDVALYDTLAAGDIPAAWLISRSKKEAASPADAFNRGLCLYLLDEWEKAENELKRAEQLLGNPPEFDISDKRPLLKALAVSGPKTALLPLHQSTAAQNGRYALLRVKWLSALCLLKLGRTQEAAPIIRLLSQYNITIS